MNNLTWVPLPLELTVTAKGQVTLRQAVLDHLGVKPGEKVGVWLLPDGRVELAPASTGHDLSSLRGALHRLKQRPISLRQMRDAIEAGRSR
jgi:bifunctional DNA-binding transcriptional regulator/antitoxin component of YhaV-PrlF toxin-antitoxin module